MQCVQTPIEDIESICKDQRLINMYKKASEIKELAYQMERPLIVFHYDADGISSAAICYKALKKQGKKPRLLMLDSIIDGLDLIKNENEIIMLDFGSCSIVNELKNAIIIDHHIPEELDKPILNPWHFGLDGSKFCSTSSLTYIVFNELSSMSLVGSAGDMQMPFTNINRAIADLITKEGIYEKKISFLRMANVPLIYALKYSGLKVFKNETAIKYFLKTCNVNAWQSFNALDEMKRKCVIKKILDLAFYTEDEENVKRFIGDSYIIKNLGMTITDFSTLLNAAGRWKKCWLGIKACFNDEQAIKEIQKQATFHKKKINEAYKIADSIANDIGNIIIIDGRKNIYHGIIGIVCNKIMEKYKKPTIGISKKGGRIKISLRARNMNVNNILKQTCKYFDNSSAGGHECAGGAEIPETCFNDFIKEIKDKIDSLYQLQNNNV